MPDTKPVFSDSGSPHAVAYEMMLLIAKAEDKDFDVTSGRAPSREWILQTYAQCRTIVNHSWNAPSTLKEYPTPKE